jgi:hypothetical protein
MLAAAETWELTKERQGVDMRKLIMAYVLLTVLSTAAGKDGSPLLPKTGKEKPAAYKLLGIRPDIDRNHWQLLQVARDCLRDSEWKDAGKALQLLLDQDEDFFLYVKEDKTGRWTSFKREANRLLGAVPPAGKMVYEATFGARAAQALAEAKKTLNHKQLVDVAVRFAHTRAGVEARLWVAALAWAGQAPALPLPRLRGTVVTVPAKAEKWPTPQAEHAYVKYLPTSLWLQTIADPKKIPARFDLRSGYVVDCTFSAVIADGPVLQALANTVIIVESPK